MTFPPRPGTRVDDTLMAQFIPITVTKSATEARSSTTTVAPDSELAVTLTPGTWDVTVKANYNVTAAGPQGIRTSWSLGAGLALGGFRMCQGPEAASTNRDSTLSKWANTTAPAMVQYGAGTNFAYFEEWAEVVATSSATLAFQWAQIISSANACQVGQGSYIRAIRIA